MQMLSAILDRSRGELVLRIHLDPTRTIADPAWLRPLVLSDGEMVPDPAASAPQVPDPSWVQETSWGIDVKDEQASVDSALREATLLAEQELARRTPLAEAAADPARPDVEALIAAPVALAAAGDAIALSTTTRRSE